MSEIIEKSAVAKGEFMIVIAEKRTIKTSCAGQTIEVLKRATAPLTLKQIVSRVRASKAGKSLKVNDVKVRCLKVLKWHAKYSKFVAAVGEGWELTRA